MLWFTLRQHRWEIFLLTGLVVIICVALFLTGQRVHHLYDQLGLAACLQAHSDLNSCTREADSFFLSPASYDALHTAFPYLYALPFLFGALIGAPLLAREIEQGTHRFAWTQGITRRRWFLTQVGILLAILLIWMGALVGVIAWWNQPYLALEGPLQQPNYDFLGVLPFLFAIFGFALGVAASALFRRVLPAIAATFLYIPIWQTLDTVIRSQLVQPTTVYFSVTSNAPDLSRQDWLISQGYVDRSGAESTALSIPNACASHASPSHPGLLQCLASHGYRQFVSYHSASHFWPMQASEGAVLLALTLLLAGITFWALQRRVI